MTNTIDHADLRRLAEAAIEAEKEWESAAKIGNPNYPGYEAADKYQDAEDAFHAAAHPAAILRLIEEVEGLRVCGTCREWSNNRFCTEHKCAMSRFDRCDIWGGMRE